jgi:phenylacetate-CoA ligase
MKGVPSIAATVLALTRHGSADRESLRRHQDRLVRRIVRHAASRVPYYQHLFAQHGVRADEIRGAEDLARIPVTRKPELRAAPIHDLLARGLDPDRLIAQKTGGSTGQRLVVYRTWLEQNLLHLYRLRALRSLGVRASDRTAAVGIRHDVHPRDNKWIGHTLRTAGLFRREHVNLFDPPEAQARRLRALAPDVVSGYPGALGRVAAYLLDAGVADIRPRLVLSGAEVLTPELRRTIEAGFRAPVFDVYGCHELNLLGWQCTASGAMHVSDDAVVVELLVDGRPAREGETGEVVVTSLHHYAMPLIRYHLGDLATRGGACSCGAPWSTIHALQGRTVDWFTLADGRVVHPYQVLLAAFTGRMPPVRQYQIVQEAADRIVMRVVLPPDFPARDLEQQTGAVRELLGPGATFEFEPVAEIRPGPNGKYRVLYSNVAPRAAEPARV